MSAADLPTRRNESWKYSDLRGALAGQAPPMAGEGAVIERLAAGAGCFETRLIGAGERDIVVEYLDADAFAPRAESVTVGEGGAYHRIVLQLGGDVALSHCRVRLGKGASFRQFVFAEGARLARVETVVEAKGEGAEIELNGAYLAAAGRHADLTSTIELSGPDGVARQLIKGVARKGGRGVFQGKIVVERAAQKTDARQHHHGMLLEDGAEIFAKPELMIYADDVQCAHGNTAGGLDAQALFYLRSRGVPETEARALLIEAFLLDTLPDWAPPNVREEIDRRIRAWLRAAA
ncbi:MAG: SufD family Fe-S cluster assembly protein [Hyphomonadaceae bacterium]|nr:SufD family Fe-S cluster assembly protein [Hyphomonadaceae bacterium]